MKILIARFNVGCIVVMSVFYGSLLHWQYQTLQALTTPTDFQHPPTLSHWGQQVAQEVQQLVLELRSGRPATER